MSETQVVWPDLTPQKLGTVLTVAGSDSSGGAGIEADIKSITANGAYALTAITALTAQNTTGVKKITCTDQETLRAVFESNFSDVKIDVIKTGLLTEDAVEILSEYVKKYHQGKAIVIDPVMVATTGSQLTNGDVLKLAVEKLIKGVTLITPNLIEANEILKLFEIEIQIRSVSDLKKIAKLISEKTGALNVLVKGGHIPWTKDGEVSKSNEESVNVTDVLYSSLNNDFNVFKSGFVNTKNTHGTGCTLASSISANLARGLSVPKAIELAISYVHGAIISTSQIGRGNGPLNHVFNIVPIASSTTKNFTGFHEGHFVDFLINHPTVKPYWQSYVHHPFVSKVANGSLPRHQFVHYLKQDYPYLVQYAKVHSLAASIAPDLHCLQREIEILQDIRKELSLHTEKLEKEGKIDFESLVLSPACQKYADYLLNVSKGGDWLEINVALAPCLIGYHEATANVEIATDIADYKNWLDSYRSDWYKQAVELGKQNLERHSRGISSEKTLKLIKIFADVSLLEVNFWNDALNATE